MQFDAEYDFVIVGAGSAGCVLANRLSAAKASYLIRAAGCIGAATAKAA